MNYPGKRISMLLFRVAYAFVILLAFCPTAHAATAQDYIHRVQAVLAQPDVYLASTTPTEPLITQGNRLGALYADTPAVIAALVHQIAQAEHEILLQTYEWDDEDEAAKAVYHALVRRLDRAKMQPNHPFVVRIMVSRTWPQESPLQQRDVRKLIAALQQRPHTAGHLTVELSAHKGSVLSILHSKSVIIDKAQAWVMTGNLHTHGGIAKDSLNLAATLTGPVVHTLRQDWLSARAVATVDAVAGQIDMPWDGHTLPVTTQSEGGLTAVVLTRRANWTPWTTSDRNPQVQGLVGLLDTATQHVQIINPSLGARQIQDALVRAILERGVQVTALVSRNMNRKRDQRFFGGDNAAHAAALYDRLLNAGGASAANLLRVYWGSDNGNQASPAYGPANIYAKVMNLDDNVLLIGSSNLNWLSFNNSRELNVALIGEHVGVDFSRRIFAPRLACAAPLGVQDLSQDQRKESNMVFNYLRNRQVL
jgi:phosphatidylserine/phosphatidylglycerophosphate/cardiolipin synthase-like enzyme